MTSLWLKCLIALLPSVWLHLPSALIIQRSGTFPWDLGNALTWSSKALVKELSAWTACQRSQKRNWRSCIQAASGSAVLSNLNRQCAMHRGQACMLLHVCVTMMRPAHTDGFSPEMILAVNAELRKRTQRRDTYCSSDDRLTTA